ncbi:MAG: hypothetical protein JF588_19260 [Caulobacterales bacterium]|nr:hypothetical protein [Caulobacterales bacterium]
MSAIPTVCTDASGARIRTVAVHLTPFAPGCEGLAIANPKRWATLYGRTPLGAVKATLKRINRPPRAVAIAAGPAPGDVDLLARPTVAQLGKASDGEAVPFATFHHGLTLVEVRAALAALVAEDWAPARAFPADL